MEFDDEEERVLAWVQKSTLSYPNLSSPITNFSSSWIDGLAFNALIHHHRPDLIDVDYVAKLSPGERLEYALRIVKESLQVSISRPELLTNGSFDRDDVVLFAIKLFHHFKSSADISSDDYDECSAFFNSTDEISVWMESLLSKVDHIRIPASSPLDFNLVSSSFTYEKGIPIEDPSIIRKVDENRKVLNECEFISCAISNKESQIIAVISQGNILLKDAILTANEQRLVTNRVQTIDAKWRKLKSSVVQTKCDQQLNLMLAQMVEMRSLALWLSDVETKYLNNNIAVASFEDATKIFNQHSILQSALESRQQRVNLLSRIIVVENQKWTAIEVEQLLNDVGTRWGRLCQWSEQRFAQLKRLINLWTSFNSQRHDFEEWLSGEETLVEKLSVDNLVAVRYAYTTLQQVEARMDQRQNEFTTIAEIWQELIELFVGDIPSGLDELAKRWDVLVEKMESLGDQVASSELFSVNTVYQKYDDVRITELSTTVQERVVCDEKSFRYRSAAEVLANRITTEIISDLFSNNTETNIDVSSSVDLSFSIGSHHSSGNSSTHKLIDSSSMDSVHANNETPMSLNSKRIDSFENALYSQNRIDSTRNCISDTSINGPSFNADKSNIDWHEELASWLDEKTNELSALSVASSASSTTLKDSLKRLNSQLETRLQEVPDNDLSLSSRFKTLFTKLNALQHAESNSSLSSPELWTELDSLEKTSRYVDEWIRAQEPVGVDLDQIKRQLEECQATYWELKRHRSRLTQLAQQFENIGSVKFDAISKKSFSSRLAALRSEWDTSITTLENRDKRLTIAYDNTPPPKYTECMAMLLGVVADLDKQLDSIGKYTVTTIATMEANIETLEEAKKRLSSLDDDFQYMERCGKDLVARCTDMNKAEQYSRALNDFSARWKRTIEQINSKYDSVSHWLHTFKQFNEESDGLNTWMEQVYVFLHAEAAALGDLATVTAQLDQCKALHFDIDTIRPNLEMLIETGHQLVQQSSPKSGKKIKNFLDTLHKKWDKTCRLASQQRDELTSSLEKTRMMEESFKKLQDFFDHIEKRHLPEYVEIYSMDEIEPLLTEYAALQTSIDNYSPSAETITTVFNEIIEKDLLEGLEDFINRVHDFTNRWSTLVSQVEGACKLLRVAPSLFSEFEDAYNQQSEWIENVKKVVAKFPKEITGDAEDISEELDKLERVLGDMPVEENKLYELGQNLIDMRIVPTIIKKKLEGFQGQFSEVIEPARLLRLKMDKNLQNVQMMEKDILDIQDWITNADRLLQNRLNMMIYADNVPQEFETLQEEIHLHHDKIIELETSVQELVLTSSERIQQQLKMISSRMADVLVKFNKFQKPCDFEEKRNQVVKELGQVLTGLEELEIKSVDPAFIEDQLLTFESFYRQLSNLKGLVEYVLKTGHLIIERRQVDNIDELEMNLADIKNQFNDLGAQVTEGKAVLEQVLMISKKTIAGINTISEWIEKMCSELKKNSSIVHDEDLLFELQTKQLEMKNIVDDTEHLLDLAEPRPLPELENKVELLNQKFKALCTKLTTKYEESSNSEVQGSAVSWESLRNDLRKWMLSVDNGIGYYESLPDGMRDEASEMSTYTKFKKEMKEKESMRLDLKKLAGEAKTNGDDRVDAELKSFNDLWNNLSLRINTKMETENKLSYAFKPLASRTSSKPDKSNDSSNDGKAKQSILALVEETLQIENECSNLLNSTLKLKEKLSENSTLSDEEEEMLNVVDPSDEKWTMLEPQIKEILERGSNLLTEITKTSNMKKFENMRQKLSRLRNEWEQVKRIRTVLLDKRWFAFKREVQSFEMILYELERKTRQAKGSAKKLANLQPDFISLRGEWAELRWKARTVGRRESVPLFNRVRERWMPIATAFDWFDADNTDVGIRGLLLDLSPILNILEESETVEQMPLKYDVGRDIVRNWVEKASTDIEARVFEAIGARLRSEWAKLRRAVEKSKEQAEALEEARQLAQSRRAVLSAWLLKTQAALAAPNCELSVLRSEHSAHERLLSDGDADIRATWQRVTAELTAHERFVEEASALEAWAEHARQSLDNEAEVRRLAEDCASMTERLQALNEVGAQLVAGGGCVERVEGLLRHLNPNYVAASQSLLAAYRALDISVQPQFEEKLKHEPSAEELASLVRSKRSAHGDSSEVHDQLVILQHLIRAETVRVGVTADITEMLSRYSSFVNGSKLRDDDRIAHCIEKVKQGLDILESSAKDEISKDQFALISADWDDVRYQIEERRRSLDLMLSASRKFVSFYEATRGELERIQSSLIRNKALEVPRDDLRSLQKSTESVVRLANKLIADFSSDDTRKVRELRETLVNLWRNVSGMATAAEAEARRQREEAETARRIAEELGGWLREACVQSELLLLDTRVDSEIAWQAREAALDLSARRGQWHKLSQYCREVSPVENWNELCELWTAVRTNLRQLRARCDPTQQYEQVAQTLEQLITWAEDLLNVLNDPSEATRDDVFLHRTEFLTRDKRTEATLDLGRQFVTELEDAISRSVELSACDKRTSILSVDDTDTSREMYTRLNTGISKLDSRWEELRVRLEEWGNNVENIINRRESLEAAILKLDKKLGDADHLRYRWPLIGSLLVESVPQQIQLIDDFTKQLSPLQNELEDINKASKDIKLNEEQKQRIKDLNSKWTALKSATSERKTKLESLYKELGPQSQAHMSSSVSGDWQRTVAANKVPFYINHAAQSTHWDHPKLTAFMDELFELNAVRLSTYRTAMKLLRLQRLLHLDLVDQKQVMTALDGQPWRSADHGHFLDVTEILSVLQSLFRPVGARQKSVDVVLSIDLALNYILNVYDPMRSGKVRVLSVRAILLTLCTANPDIEEKYKSLFNLVAVRNSVDQKGLGTLLHDVIQTIRPLGEIASFGGSNVEPSVRSCFVGATSIQTARFVSWMKCDPQSLVWLPMLNQLRVSENVRHSARCNSCRVYPIVGMRYRCLRCFNLDMCQKCFLAGNLTRSHKKSHPMEEYCTASSSSEDVKAFARLLRNRIKTRGKSNRKNLRETRLGYLPVTSVLEGPQIEQEATPGELSAKLELYSARIADAEHHRSLSTVSRSFTGSNEDVNNKLLSPQQVVMTVDRDEQSELDALIASLEADNEVLAAEYASAQNKSDQLHSEYSSLSLGSNEGGEIAMEARMLQLHKSRLESRMKVLEEHNHQLEAQLERLKKLVEQPPLSSVSPSSSFVSIDYGRPPIINHKNMPS